MLVELRGIHKRYGAVHANDGVSLSFAGGTIQGLLGENGAGKSTLMKILSGYQSADAGEILLDGNAVRFGSPAKAIRAGIGMLHQDPLDVPALSVLDNFLLGRERGLAAARVRGRRALLELCGRFGFALGPDMLVGSLSIGERQQLEIVRLLSLGIGVMILDEPTTGISAPQKKLLFAALHRLVASGLIVIFVSHKLDEVEELCSRVTILRQGRVIGAVQAPFSAQALVEMMFGQCLAQEARESFPLGETVVRLEDVSVQTYRVGLTHISLDVQHGEVVGLAGLEGSGQTLVMRVCAGLQRVTAGRVLVGGLDMTSRSYYDFRRAGIGYVPAARLEEGLLGGMSLEEHLALLDDRSGFLVPWGEIRTRAQLLVDGFHIVGQPTTLARELSGGNQQRALLALLPDVLRVAALEHPTRGLDIGSSRWVWEKLLQRRQQGTAILFTSTDLDELVTHSDRIVVFSGGVMSLPIRASDMTCDQLGYMIGGRAT